MKEILNILGLLFETLYNFIDTIIKIPVALYTCIKSLLSSFSEDVTYLIIGIVIFGLVFGFAKFIKSTLID